MIKTKARSQVEDKELTEEAYQVDDPIPSKMVIDTNSPPTLVSISREVYIIQPSSHRSKRTSEATEDEEEEELRDDVQSESDEESFELSD